MKRSEILERLGYSVPELKKKRIIIHADIAAEADDQFAIAHHLLTPYEDILGIIAGNFEWRHRTFEGLKHLRYTSMEKSYEEGKKLLKLMDIDDIPLLKGAKDYIEDRNNLPVSEGSEFIIQEALKKPDEPLYIALQGTLTDLAVAYLTEPKIADNVVAIWIGGGTYPNGGKESNLQQDIYAAQVLFDSPMKIWQFPLKTYASSYISFAELIQKVRPCGELGEFLCDTMFGINDWYGKVAPQSDFPHGEIWSLGDQPTVSALLESPSGKDITVRKAPTINDDMTYSENPYGKEIVVFNSVDKRLLFDDFFAKIWICYKK